MGKNKEENIYQIIFDQAPIGIYTINKDGFIDSFNPKMLEMNGAKSVDEVIDLNVFSLDSYKKVGLDKFFREGLNGKDFTTEVKYVSQIGKKETWRHYRGVPIFLPDSKTVDKLLLLVEDITKAKEIDKAKTEFVSLASHQLRTPLSTVNWYTGMLLAGDVGKINEDQKRYLNEIYNGNKRMIVLVNALLNVSRIEMDTLSVESQPTDIINIAKQVLGELPLQVKIKKLKIVTEFDEGLGLINADPKLVEMIFQNLFENAVKYTPEGGDIEFKIKKKSPMSLSPFLTAGQLFPRKIQTKFLQNFIGLIMLGRLIPTAPASVYISLNQY